MPLSKGALALGCLHGQVIGDAFGARYEFESAEKVTTNMELDRQADGFIPIRGGGVFMLQPGQFTDDTEMALSLADSLINCCRFKPVDIACAYVHWAQTGPKTIGIATKAALWNIVETVGDSWRTQMTADEKNQVYYSVILNAEKCNQQSLSNGCLMRISPLAIAAHSLSDRKVESYCIQETNLTHTNPIAVDAVFVYVSAIRALLNGKSVEVCDYASYTLAFKEVYGDAKERAKTELVKNFLEAAQTRPCPVKLTDGREVMGDGKYQGYLGVALQGAFYELLHAKTFYEGVTNTISRGGDTDTNGCITGALLGARFGVDDIPIQWKDAVKQARPRSTFTTVDFREPELTAERLLSAFSTFTRLSRSYKRICCRGGRD